MTDLEREIEEIMALDIDLNKEEEYQVKLSLIAEANKKYEN